jgi:hypothetical protein
MRFSFNDLQKSVRAAATPARQPALHARQWL